MKWELREAFRLYDKQGKYLNVITLCSRMLIIKCKNLLQIMVCILIFNLGNGYITTNTLKEILREIDSTLNEHNLDQIVDEVDEDGSGTIDFDEFMAMMTGE